jgi:ABC-2 type transport system ATP-binding protein
MLIQARNLKKYYKKVRAVDGVDLEVREGEILGILGPNGAGKSTTISMISSLVRPDEGEIFYRDKDIIKYPQYIRKILGLVPQEVALYPDLSARENLTFFGRLYGLRGKELNRRMNEVLDLLGLNGRSGDSIKNYSGGMKRRVNIGAALLHHPELLIMDEPTVGIDPQSRSHILKTVKELSSRGMTIIYTSHYMEEVEFLCHRIYIMDYGKIIASGTKDELKDMVSRDNTVELQIDTVTERFIGDLKRNIHVKHINVEGSRIFLAVDRDYNILSHIFHASEKSGVNLQSIQIKKPTLEDVFLHLTGRGLRD